MITTASAASSATVTGTKLKSEDVISTNLDKCLADGLIKAGSGLLAGAALSLVIFRRRMWPVHMGFGAGIGMGLSNCQHKLGTSFPSSAGTGSPNPK